MKKISLYFHHGILIITLFIYSCEPENNTKPQNLFTGVYIVNEGNFTWQNASISFYDLQNRQVNLDIYSAANQSPLGDVAYSITILSQQAFVVVNNSARIVVINPETAVKSGEITGFNSPRHLLRYSDSMAFVSDLYSPCLWIVNLNRLIISGKIPLNKTVENLLLSGNTLFATNWSKLSAPLQNNNTVMLIDVTNLTLFKEIEVGTEPNSMVLDKINRVWVLCSGGFTGNELPSLHSIDQTSQQIIKSFIFPTRNPLPSKLCINKAADTLCYLYGSVYKMPIESESLPSNPLIEQNGRLFYGLSVNPDNSEIYVSDALDYTQRGTVFRYSASGQAIDSFKVGINPGYFCFKRF